VGLVDYTVISLDLLISEWRADGEIGRGGEFHHGMSFAARSCYYRDFDLIMDAATAPSTGSPVV